MIKKPAVNERDIGSILGLGRSSGEENGNQLQYSCLGNPMDRGAWLITVHGVTRDRHNLVTKQQITKIRSTAKSQTASECLMPSSSFFLSMQSTSFLAISVHVCRSIKYKYASTS